MAPGGVRTWSRLMFVKDVKGTVPCTFLRTYAKETGGVIDRVKKFVFGDEEPPEQSEVPRDEESYYQLSTHPVPPVYSMKSSDIKATVERISKEVAHTEDVMFSDNVLKYKILSKCHEEFGLLVPSWQLRHITNMNHVLQFYTSAEPDDTRTFKSIDLDQLPPNLTIGGQVPRK